MNYIKAAVQVILAVKEIFVLVKELVKTFKISKEQKRLNNLKIAIDASSNSKTKEEMQRANENATSNLP